MPSDVELVICSHARRPFNHHDCLRQGGATWPRSPRCNIVRVRGARRFLCCGVVDVQDRLRLSRSIAELHSARLTMQALRVCTHAARATRAIPRTARVGTRSLSTGPSSSSDQPRPVPWFIDPSEAGPSQPKFQPIRPTPVHPLPTEISETHPITALHAQLLESPHLEPAFLLVRDPIPTEVGPPLPLAAPRGRRQRGRTYFGEGVSDDVGGLWRWIVIAQVKEGSEKRGAIESVARVVRRAVSCGCLSIRCYAKQEGCLFSFLLQTHRCSYL